MSAPQENDTQKPLFRLIFSIIVITLLVFITSSSFVVYNEFSENLTKTSDINSKIFSDSYKTYLDSNIEFVEHVARQDQLVRFVMHTSLGVNKLKDSLSNEVFQGQPIDFFVYDFSGLLILQTDNDSKLAMTSVFKDDILNKKIPHSIQGFKNKDEAFLEVGVPIYYEGSPEGILFARIPVLFKSKFFDYEESRNYALEVFSNSIKIQEFGDVKEIKKNGIESNIVLDGIFSLHFWVGKSVINKTIFSLVLSSFLIVSFVSIFIFYFARKFGLKYIVEPHLELQKSHKVNTEIFYRLDSLLEASGFGYWELDLSNNLLTWDDRNFRVFNINKASSQFTLDSFREILHAEDLERIDYQLSECIKNKESGEFEFRSIDKDEEIQFIKGKSAILTDEEGDVSKVFGFNWNVTKEVQADLELLRQRELANHNLKLASIGELAAGVGHEINNPLTIIKLYVDIIVRQIETSEFDVVELKESLSKVDIAADRIGNITKGLRAFSRSDSNQKTNFSSLDAIKESFELVGEIYKKEGIDLHFKNDTDSDCYIHGNRGQFQQVIMNLISNAKDATSENKERKIDINISNSNGKVILKIGDNGIGIPDDIKKKIFDPFFTTKGVNKGTGIGLSLVHKFVEDFSGTLEVESEIGRGTIFVIEIPEASNPEIKDKKNEADEIVNQEKFNLRVLLADDEEEIRSLLSRMLVEMGSEVTSVENGKMAYDLFISKPDSFDLIISDMKMPEIDGPTLLKMIRGEKNIKQPKFFFITGGINIDFTAKDKEINQLIDGYIYKPMDKDKILEAFQKCFPGINISPS